MANYVSSTSDKSKKVAMKRLLMGGVGLHLFYVGRIGVGIIRLVISLAFWILIIDGIAEGIVEMIISGIVFLVVINVFDLIKLSLGKFKDNVGQYLRQ